MAIETNEKRKDQWIEGYLCENGHKKSLNESKIMFWKIEDEPVNQLDLSYDFILKSSAR